MSGNESPARFDVVVIGVGAMGSAALYHLARRGKRVLGLERFEVPHEYGSSHGYTRIIRLAYFEHPNYVPLLRRAYSLWDALEREAGETLLVRTGSITSGRPEAAVFSKSLESCRLHDLPHEVLTAREVARRFPGYRFPATMMSLFQPDGGFLVPERCIVAHAEAASRRGAVVHTGERVLDWSRRGSDAGGPEAFLVRTDRGAYLADRIVVTAGAWVGQLLPRLAPVAVPERQVLAWLRPLVPDHYRPDRFPVFNIDAGSEGAFYGFPEYGVPGVKLGKYQRGGDATDPDAMDRRPHPADERPLRAFVERYLPGAAGPTVLLKTCLFTNTPDEDFIIDRVPGAPGVIVGGGFSGHGFKFASVVGEMLADLAMDRSLGPDCAFLGIDRLLR